MMLGTSAREVGEDDNDGAMNVRPPGPTIVDRQSNGTTMMMPLPSSSSSSTSTSTSSEVVVSVASGSSGSSSWSPSGMFWKDFCYFVGPGWFVSIAYVDPGNYQADIQAGATSRYSLLWVVWWTSLLSIYVQILCVRLAYYGNMTLAEAQAKYSSSNVMRYVNWAIAEFSTIITDLPEVIGIGIAGNIFFGWPYYAGVLLSLLTTMMFLATMRYGMRTLEGIVAFMVAIMSVSLVIEMSFVDVQTSELFRGWWTGFTSVRQDDIFAITGVVGSVVMPHNLYLHTAACRSRPVSHKAHVPRAVFYSSLEPVLPILVGFVVNLALVSIAAERVYNDNNNHDDDADADAAVGLSDFCRYFSTLAAGCSLWGIALLAAGQSSAITTTYTGQYVMDGFLHLELLSVQSRAILTRLVAIAPCILVSVLLPHRLNEMVNLVNSALSFLLPFAFTPLVKFNCSINVMGTRGAARGPERVLLHAFAVAVYLVNALALSLRGGGFFGDWRHSPWYAERSILVQRIALVALEIAVQIFYAWWNYDCLAGSSNGGAVVVAINPEAQPRPLPRNEDEDPWSISRDDVDDTDDAFVHNNHHHNNNNKEEGRSSEDFVPVHEDVELL